MDEARTQKLPDIRRRRKHWCKHCDKSFPSGMALGGHMTGHRHGDKQPGVSISMPEQKSMPPKAQCRLCYKVFASCDALRGHMRVHSEKKRVAEPEVARQVVAALSNVNGDHNAMVFSRAKRKRTRWAFLDSVASQLMLKYGRQEVDAACTLMLLSGNFDTNSAPMGCNGGGEKDGGLVYRVEKAEVELNDVDHGLIGDIEFRKQGIANSDEEMKARNHECKLCGKAFASGQALGGHKRSHYVRSCDQESVSIHPNSIAILQQEKQQLEVDSELSDINIPALAEGEYISMSSKSEMKPWWVTSSLQREQMLGIVSN